MRKVKNTPRQRPITLESLDKKLDRVIDGMATKADIRRLDRRIDTVDQRIDSVEAKTDRIIDALVSKVDNARIDRLEKTVDERFKQVIEAVDRLATSVENMTLEYAAISAKLTRYEKWFEILAKKTGVKLPL